MTNAIRYDGETLYADVEDVSRYWKRATGATLNLDDPDQEATDAVKKHLAKWSARFDRRTGQSYRANRVVDETHDHGTMYYWLSGHPIRLREKDIITPLDPDEGDKLELYDGNQWTDWVADESREESRSGDYWVDADVGMLYVYDLGILRPRPKFRVSYRFGNDDGYVPADVTDAVAAATAADLIQGDFYGDNTPGHSQEANADPGQSAEQWKAEFDETVHDYTRVRWV